MSGLLVDSNVVLDILTEDSECFPISTALLQEAAERRVPIINPLIFSEISVRFRTVEALEAAVPRSLFWREPLPWEAGFLAGKCFVRYRRAGGTRTSPLPDFYIGAHAAVRGYTLLTRDRSRYQTFFPSLRVIAP